VQAIEFFKAICDEFQTYQIKFADLSNYLCKYNPNLDDVVFFISLRKMFPFKIELSPIISTHHSSNSINLRADK